MSRSLGVSIENSFIKGLVTEFSGLNFPENSCVDALNCIFSEKGEVFRRGAIDMEEGGNYKTISSTLATDIVRSFYWRGAGQSSDTNLVVYQIGNTLYFYKDEKDVPLSATSTSITYTLDPNRIAGSPSTRNDPCAFVSGNSKLFIAHRYMQPFYLEYNETTKTLTATKIDIQIRDFQVLDDGFDNDEEPKPSNAAHLYNLYNQGWDSDLVSQWKSLNSGKEPPKTTVPWYFRNADAYDGRGAYGFGPAWRLHYPILGTSLAPRGKFIYNAFNINRSVTSGISGLTSKTSKYERPSAIAFMNSRVFYSGIFYEGYGSSIYFSSILKETSNEILFYQRGDPTAETTYELLSNDGGIIVIPEATNIVGLASTKSYLLVFCTNGIWSVSGSEGVGFTATDYMIEKVSDVPCYSSFSIIDIEHNPIWWNNDGIYSVSVEQGRLSVVSLTKGTIQTLFDSIPASCKTYVMPSYNRLTSEVSWYYSSDVNNPLNYDSVLVFRATTKAFYKHQFSTSPYPIRGVVTSTNRQAQKTEEIVLDNSSNAVLDNASEPVSIVIPTTDDVEAILDIYLLIDRANNRICFANLFEQQTIDWLTLGNSENFESYIVSGYRVRGDAIRKFQMPYIQVYTRFVANSSCKISGIWDYATSELSNQYTTEQEVCTNDDRRSVNWRRLRIRGTGYTLQLKFRSVGGAPFHLIGWSCQEVVNDRT